MKVLISDDSILVRNILREILSQDNSINVIGEAANGQDAVSMATSLLPDIIIMDIDMPIMNGLEATAIIKQKTKIPVLVFSHNDDPMLPFKALELGAADFLHKPDFEDLNNPVYSAKFLNRLKVLSGFSEIEKKNIISPVLLKTDIEKQMIGEKSNLSEDQRSIKTKDNDKKTFFISHNDIIVIGTSTGGPIAVSTLLSALPSPFPVCIAIVQHIEKGFDLSYAKWLSSETGHDVSIAENSEDIKSGKVYIAPANFHLKIDGNKLVLDDSPAIRNQKPSIDVLFKSAASNFHGKTVGILLTGMGNDGADGCKDIISSGGFTIIQDKNSSLIFSMPSAAIEKNAASIVLPLDSMGHFIMSITKQAK